MDNAAGAAADSDDRSMEVRGLYSSTYMVMDDDDDDDVLLLVVMMIIIVV